MTRSPSTVAKTASCLAALALLAGCSSVQQMMGGDKIDYKSQAAKTTPLDVPPDLTQLSRDPRYQAPASGTVSASNFQAPQTAAAAVPAVAPAAVGEMRIERAGNQRWLVTSLTPEQLWPQLRAFWQERGFVLSADTPEAGVMETDWAENRAKLPQDIIRRTLGRVVESLYSTGERDRFRTRVERAAAGTEVYISHRGLEEVYTNAQRDSTKWQPRPADTQLEAEMLTRLMTKLGAKDKDAPTQTADAPAGTVAAAPQARARVLQGESGAALQIDEAFDRAWRRVGLALDRSGFTVEDRDRSGGLYYVRYVDPASVGREEPGFFSRLFGNKAAPSGPSRYRIAVKGSGDVTTVSVLDPQGAPEGGAVGRRIVALLVEDLK